MSTPTSKTTLQITHRPILAYILVMLKPFKGTLCLMLGVAALYAFSISVRPYLLKQILDRLPHLSNAPVFSSLQQPILLYLSLYLAMTTSFRLYEYFVEVKMIPRLRGNLAESAMALLLDKSHRYFQNHFSGSLTNKVNDLITNVPELIQIVINRFFCYALSLIIASITLWHINAYFALATIIWSGTFILGALFFSKRLTQLSHDWSEKGSEVTGKLTDVLSNILSVRLFTGNFYEKEQLRKTFSSAIKAEQKLKLSFLYMWGCYGYSAFVLQIFNFYFLCKGRQEGWISLGDFALVLSINIELVDFLWQVSQDFSLFSKLYGKITQALEPILTPNELIDAPNATALKATQGEITFTDVRFQYPGTDHVLFDHTTITIPAGQKVGLVGYSGGGKSTFVNLILRLYDISSGSIRIDHQDIRDVTQESLRRNIAIIPQDPSLFHRTLFENIAYATPNATQEDVVRAAQQAYAHDFIRQLPEGYQALVGERGVKLSGGQRQRIAIARAILKNSPLLILDEATSQLDSVTEKEIQKSLWTLMQSKTTLVIAHRLSTLLQMDRILVFDKGRIVEDGTHAQLIQAKGLYHTLWNAQIGGFLPNQPKESAFLLAETASLGTFELQSAYNTQEPR